MCCFRIGTSWGEKSLSHTHKTGWYASPLFLLYSSHNPVIIYIHIYDFDMLSLIQYSMTCVTHIRTYYMTLLPRSLPQLSVLSIQLSSITGTH